MQDHKYGTRSKGKKTNSKEGKHKKTKEDPLNPYFNELSWIINDPAYPNSVLAPEFAEALNLEYNTPSIFDKELDEWKQVDAKDLQRVSYSAVSITLSSHIQRTFWAPNGKDFTVKDLVQSIVKFEEEDRLHPKAKDFNGNIDLHSLHFEGLIRNSNGTYTSSWGS